MTARNARRARAAVTAMFVLNGALYGAWASRIPDIQQRFALDPGVLGLYLLVLAGGAILSFPLAGRCIDRFGAAATTRVVALLYCPALALIGFSPTAAWLGFAIFVFGACHGAMDVAMNGWGAEVERAYGRSIMSLFHAMFSAGAGIGAAGGALAAWLDLGYSGHFAGFALLAAALMTLTRVDWRVDPGSSENRDRGFVLPRGGLLIIALIAFSINLSEGAMADWSAVYLASVILVSDSQAALGYAVFSMAMVTMRSVGDRLITAFGAARIVASCSLTAVLGAILAVTADSVFPVYVGFALMGFGYALVIPLAFARAAKDGGANAGAAIAGVASFAYGGLLLGPPVIGWIAQLTDLRIAFGLLILLAAYASIASRAFRAEPPRQGEN